MPGIKVDKHSTGGVGDKVSIVLAPLVAACGVVVPKMSGRGLGHTGGTLDKLESIPGFRIALSLDEFTRMLAEVGCCLIGQTADIAPADKKLYALRDVTATVESLPLIAASVMSKKLAEGSDALVLDVKCGRGAFMKTPSDARALARSLVSIGEAGGVRTEAFITRMDTPLGRAVGNAVEIAECIETLKGRGPEDLDSHWCCASARAWCGSAGKAATDAEADRLVREALSSGAALAKLRADHRVAGRRCLGGGRPGPPAGRRAHPRRARPSHRRASRRSTRCCVGRAAVALGAGRDKKGDPVDLSAGIRMLQEARRGRAAPASRCWSCSTTTRRACPPPSPWSTQAIAIGTWPRPSAAEGTGLGARGRRDDVRGRAVARHRASGPRRTRDEGYVDHIDRYASAVGRACSASWGWPMPLSTNRRAISYRVVGWGLGLQVLFALIVLKTRVGRTAFEVLGDRMRELLDFSVVGSRVRVRSARRQRGLGPRS